MSSAKNNPLDRALETVAQDDALEFPNALLEQRLRDAHQTGKGTSTTSSHRAAFSRVAGWLLIVVLSGAAVGSTLGIERIKSWWYSIVVDGQEVSGTVEGDGPTMYEFLSEDGYQVNVQVNRRQLNATTVQTTLDARERKEGHVEATREIHEQSVAPEGPQATNVERFDRSVLEEASALHTWTNPDGEQLSLWLGLDLEGTGSWVLLDHVDSDEFDPVEVILRTARLIAEGGLVSIQQHEDGRLELEISNGKGWTIALAFGTGLSSGVPPAPVELTTPSGRVRVKTGE